MQIENKIIRRYYLVNFSENFNVVKRILICKTY